MQGPTSSSPFPCGQAFAGPRRPNMPCDPATRQKGHLTSPVVVAQTTRDRVDLLRELRIKGGPTDDLVLSEIKRDSAGHGLTLRQCRTEGYAACVHLTPLSDYDIWCNESRATAIPIAAGSIHINDMRHDWLGDIRGPFHVVNFYFPQTALDLLTEDLGAGAIDHIDLSVQDARRDPIFANMIAALRPALSRADEPNQLFVDYAVRSILIHLSNTYGGLRTSWCGTGRLAPWQERRAREVMLENLAANMSLGEVATACRVSTSHFSQAFRRTFGLPPHRWLVIQRIERAKTLILNSRQPLSEIALATGFADQSHFTRVFSQHVKVPPGVWRRLQQR